VIGNGLNGTIPTDLGALSKSSSLSLSSVQQSSFWPDTRANRLGLQSCSFVAEE
jgi:hypothetical protein